MIDRERETIEVTRIRGFCNLELGRDPGQWQTSGKEKKNKKQRVWTGLTKQSVKVIWSEAFQ